MHLRKIGGGVAAAFGLTAALGSTAACAGTPCEDVKSQIAAKLEAKGVKAYTLDVVAADEVKDQKVVGSCEGGTKKIVYSKGTAAAATSEPPAANP
jgi:hypothetical protein